ncbi:MAG: hypothetical protein LBG60_17065 [Bifidobacteriaceae bacterium]|jgi:hypothetical protein|nr:hypothetical protein [Bifidobacteriaceae bacterium]
MAQAPDSWPAVSLIVAAEDADQAAAAAAELLARPYPGEFEILVAAPPGPADGLEQLAADPRVAVVHAQTGSKAALVNAAAFAARYEILSWVRQGAGNWAELLQRAVAAMEVTGADVVGGSWMAFGLGSAEQAISRALNSSVAMGPRPSRAGVGKGPVDSVRMVVIRRDAFERAGGLVGDFAGARDWELQHRVRRAGGMVWLDPALALRGRTPGSAAALARLMFRAGAWRRRVVAAHPKTLTPRYALPPALVAGLVLALVGGVTGGLGVGSWLFALAALPAVYALVVALAALAVGRGLRLGLKIRLWWAVMVIHLSWGAGFLIGRRPSAK